MTSTTAVPRLHQQSPARQADPAAAVRDQRYRMVQLALFTVGAILMPLGIIAICLGWYGTSHAHYAYDQSTYLISGGVLGLGLTFLGGFLYFGAWLAKVGSDQRDTARQLTDAMFALADLMSQQTNDGARPLDINGFQPNDGLGMSELTFADTGAVPVLAGNGSTAHRRDCALIAHRDDLQLLTDSHLEVTTCRVCRPLL
ncbi:MAG: hypothetical protein ABI232_12730 [Jatrophihabitantaceae bacterium]